MVHKDGNCLVYLEGPQVDPLLEPDGVEVETVRGSVGVEVTSEVMHQHFVDLIFCTVRWARIDHGTRIFLLSNRPT
jgi:hypothetical protein